MQPGLVGGEGFAIDASVIEADTSNGRKVDGKPTVWPEDEDVTRPVHEYLDAVDSNSKCDSVGFSAACMTKPASCLEPVGSSFSTSVARSSVC
ncbi:MAG: hypothetical protein WAS21_27400 [Geminicoccaceae bacterium]